VNVAVEVPGRTKAETQRFGAVIGLLIRPGEIAWVLVNLMVLIMANAVVWHG
jgi:hypothetical protein